MAYQRQDVSYSESPRTALPANVKDYSTTSATSPNCRSTTSRKINSVELHESECAIVVNYVVTTAPTNDSAQSGSPVQKAESRVLDLKEPPFPPANQVAAQLRLPVSFVPLVQQRLQALQERCTTGRQGRSSSKAEIYTSAQKNSTPDNSAATDFCGRSDLNINIGSGSSNKDAKFANKPHIRSNSTSSVNSNSTNKSKNTKPSSNSKDIFPSNSNLSESFAHENIRSVSWSATNALRGGAVDNGLANGNEEDLEDEDRDLLEDNADPVNIEDDSVNTLAELVEKYLELLYEESPYEKLKCVRLVARLARQSSDTAEFLATNESLMAALSRTMREETRNSVRIGAHIASFFALLSRQPRLHDKLMHHKVGDMCMKALELEITRCQLWCSSSSFHPRASRLQDSLITNTVSILYNMARFSREVLAKMARRGITSILVAVLEAKQNTAATEAAQSNVLKANTSSANAQRKLFPQGVNIHLAHSLVNFLLFVSRFVELKNALKSLPHHGLHPLVVLVDFTTANVVSANYCAAKSGGHVSPLDAAFQTVLENTLKLLINLSHDPDFLVELVRSALPLKLVNQLQNLPTLPCVEQSILLYQLSTDERCKSTLAYSDAAAALIRRIACVSRNTFVPLDLAAVALNLSLKEKNAEAMACAVIESHRFGQHELEFENNQNKKDVGHVSSSSLDQQTTPNNKMPKELTGLEVVVELATGQKQDYLMLKLLRNLSMHESVARRIDSAQVEKIASYTESLGYKKIAVLETRNEDDYPYSVSERVVEALAVLAQAGGAGGSAASDIQGDKEWYAEALLVRRAAVASTAMLVISRIEQVPVPPSATRSFDDDIILESLRLFCALCATQRGASLCVDTFEADSLLKGFQKCLETRDFDDVIVLHTLVVISRLVENNAASRAQLAKNQQLAERIASLSVDRNPAICVAANYIVDLLCTADASVSESENINTVDTTDRKNETPYSGSDCVRAARFNAQNARWLDLITQNTCCDTTEQSSQQQNETLEAEMTSPFVSATKNGVVVYENVGFAL